MATGRIREDAEHLHLSDPFRRSREGDIPSATDSTLLNALESASEEIGSLEKELKAIVSSNEEVALVDQLIQRQALEGYLEACKVLTLPSPIQRIPAEILCQIFEQVCTDVIVIAYTFTSHPAEDALRLGQVCSRWRAVASTCPSLFTQVRVQLGIQPHDVERLDRTLALMADILGWSQPLKTLSVTMVVYETSTPVLATVIPRLLHFLTPFISRVQTLKFPHPQLLIQPANTFGALRSLSLGSSRTLGKIALDLTRSAPNLISLVLLGEVEGVTLQWDKLQSISFRYCSLPYIWQILSYCQQVETLLIHTQIGHNSHESSKSAWPIITLKNLITLDVQSLGSAYIGAVLSALFVPSLSTLKCKSLHLSPAIFASIANLVQRSGCTIVHLQVHHVRQALQFPDLSGLALFPRLETLVCIQWQDIGNLCQMLSSQLMLPRLRKLELRCRRELLPIDTFLAMVQHRWDNEDRTLESVLIQVRHDEAVTLPPLEKLQKEGLRIHIDTFDSE